MLIVHISEIKGFGTVLYIEYIEPTKLLECYSLLFYVIIVGFFGTASPLANSRYPREISSLGVYGNNT